MRDNTAAYVASEGDSPDSDDVTRLPLKPGTVTVHLPAPGATAKAGSSGQGRSVNRTRQGQPWVSLAVSTLSILAGLLVWHLLSVNDVVFLVSFENVPTPGAVGVQLWELLGGSEFYTHIGVSVQRILISFAIASVLGILVGVFMGRSQIYSDMMMPYIEILRPIPAVAWIPLAILMFPSEESSIIYITTLGAFFPIVLSTVHGVRQTPEVYVRAAKSLGAGRAAILRHVVLPGALPHIMSGLAIGMGVAWFSLLAGEIISGQYGIGYFTWSSYSLIEYENIVIGMLTIGGLGTLSTWLVRQASKPALRWQESER
jgi:NitT/TauT family transport system permease protein